MAFDVGNISYGKWTFLFCFVEDSDGFGHFYFEYQNGRYDQKHSQPRILWTFTGGASSIPQLGSWKIHAYASFNSLCSQWRRCIDFFSLFFLFCLCEFWNKEENVDELTWRFFHSLLIIIWKKISFKDLGRKMTVDYCSDRER